MLYSYIGGDECQRENKLVPSSGTYLCSMQGNMCRLMTLEGKSPPGKKRGIKLQKGYKRDFLARHETSSGYMVDNQSQKASIRLNKEIKTHDNATTT